jgi:hypothetical protein
MKKLLVKKVYLEKGGFGRFPFPIDPQGNNLGGIAL